MLLSDLASIGPMTADELQDRGLPPDVPPVWVSYALAKGLIEETDQVFHITPTGRARLEELRDDGDDSITVGLPRD